MQKLWIASELFYPEETSTAFILSKIADKLTNKYNVEIVCGEPVYDSLQGDPSFKLSENIEINRISLGVNDKNNLKNRAFRFIGLSFKMFFFLFKNLKKGDKLFIVTNPAPFLILCSFLKFFKKFEWIILVHDVFPENTIPAEIIKNENNFIFKILKSIFDKAYSKADKLIVLGRDMREVILQKTNNKKQKIEIIENWADCEQIFPIPSNNISNKIVLQYAGNIGRVQGLKELILCLKNSGNKNIYFEIIGEGALKDDLKKLVTENNLNNINFGNAFKRAQQNEILNSCDMAIVTLAEGMYGLGVPSKTYNILAAGKPIIYFGPKNSEIDLLIKEEGIGISFEMNERRKIEDFFKNLDGKTITEFQQKSQKIVELAKTKFNEEVILKKFVDFI